MRREPCYNRLAQRTNGVRDRHHFVARYPGVDEQYAGPALHDNGLTVNELALVGQHTLRDLTQHQLASLTRLSVRVRGLRATIPVSFMLLMSFLHQSATDAAHPHRVTAGARASTPDYSVPSAGKRSGSPSRGNWSSWKVRLSVIAAPVARRTWTSCCRQ